MPRKANQSSPDELKKQTTSGDETGIHQTDSDIHESEPVDAAFQEDGSISQTGTEIDTDEAEGDAASGASGSEGEDPPAEQPLNSESYQTDIENGAPASGDAGGEAQAPIGQDSEASIPQTGTDFSANSAKPKQNHGPSPSDTTVSQTGKKKPKDAVPSIMNLFGIRKAAGKKSAESQSGKTGKKQSQSDTGQPPAAAVVSGGIKPARRVKSTPVVSIDETRSVETESDKIQNDLLDLVESMKGKRILTGTIQGVERSEDNHNISYAVLYHGEFKVIIPAEETVDPPADFRDRMPGDVMHYMITKRLGAEVDYIVKGVDPKSGIAAASRLEAMAMKRKEYYFGTDRDGNNLLYEGINAEARIISVIRTGIFVDLFGVEVYIALKELSYQRWLDASQYFQPGQRVLVRILSIDRSNRNKIQVAASVKQAGENPYEKALRKYTPGSRYVGTVSVVDTNGVFVSLDGGIDCLCSYPKRGRPPRGSRVTVRIIGMNDDNNRIWGVITHMTLPR